MTHRVRHLRVSALAIAAALCLAAAPGDAAGRNSEPHAAPPGKAKTAKVLKAAPKAAEETTVRIEPTGVWTSSEGDRACYKGRRKLWQDGQGWVVKRVAVCP